MHTYNGYVLKRGGFVGRGVPGLRAGERIGIAVPDMQRAHAYPVGVTGCAYVYSLRETRHDDDLMPEHLNIGPWAVKLWQPGHPAGRPR
jgi:hypothetical protein